jgi:DNA polymerase-1
MIHGVGPEYSELMIVTDYCTQEDLKAGKPLQGGTGKLIDQYLRENGASLQSFYRTSYIKNAIPGYNSKARKKAREALTLVHQEANWNHILTEEIKVINPRVILCLGELALNYLTNEKGISKYRGSILPLCPEIRQKIDTSRHIRVVPSIHPRDIFSNPTMGMFTRLDFAKALRQRTSRGPIEEPGILWIARDSNQLENYIRRIRDAKFITTDIETRHNVPICASLCGDGQEAISFPLMDPRENTLDHFNIAMKYDEVLRSSIPKVNQNMNYDWTILERCGYTVNNIIGDTMLMANVIYPELPKSLQFLTSIYTDMAFYKDEGDFSTRHFDFDQLMYYNAKDALATWKVWDFQQKEAEELNVKHFYFNFVHPLFYHYRKIDKRGIQIDELRRFELLEKYTNLLDEHQTAINQFSGRNLNVRSNQQVGRFLYEEMKCPLHTHPTDSGNQAYSTDEDTLTNMYLNEYIPEHVKTLVKQIILCRKIEHALLLLENPYHHDGRMRTHYNVAGTKTGRTSTSQSIGWLQWYDPKNRRKTKSTQFGTAFQKIPKHGFDFEKEHFGDDIISMFVPSPGYEFFSFDGKNAEGRVVCVLATDWDTLEYIEEEKNDLHKLTASWIFDNKPLNSITKKERHLGKTARHAGNLGQSGYGLSIQVYRSAKYCNEVMRIFHERAPKVRSVFHYQIQKLIRTNSALTNPFGRRRDFFGRTLQNEHDVFKEAYSFIPQGTVSDHFKIVSLDIAETFPKAYQLGEFHDGLLYEIPIGCREEFADIVTKATSREIDFQSCTLSRDRRLRIPVEMQASPNSWADLKEITAVSSPQELIA